ncbi:hypothetical protein ABE61_20085 [Lysinibacillus sphaericus]|nr:hypothetical protein [Lysinibacillus sphaericus]MBG9479257.1 hypothetical protein [Lysinibacillus sphaericus]MBG9594502.1 hypothetical protein [Lysinibacillus sphaericus]
MTFVKTYAEDWRLGYSSGMSVIDERRLKALYSEASVIKLILVKILIFFTLIVIFIHVYKIIIGIIVVITR